MTEELGKAAEGLGACHFLAQHPKPASVLRRVCLALRMLHVFEVILWFSSCLSLCICLGGKEKVKRSSGLSTMWAGTAFLPQTSAFID